MTESTECSSLHYIYDPLCGWCYAAAPLLDAVAEAYPALALQLHAGGLLKEQHVDEGLARYIRQHDARIHQLSHQPFGDAYLHGLLEDRTLVLDSSRVIAAMLAMQELEGSAQILRLLKSIQHAHYVEGLRVCEPGVMEPLLAEHSEAAVRYRQLLESLATDRNNPVARHIDASRRLMSEYGVGGFPAFILEHRGQGRYLDHRPYYGDLDGFLTLLEPLLS